MLYFCLTWFLVVPSMALRRVAKPEITGFNDFMNFNHAYANTIAPSESSPLCQQQLIFNVGLWKTGTTSFSKYLHALGYDEEYGGRGKIRMSHETSMEDISEFLGQTGRSSHNNPFMQLMPDWQKHVVYSSDFAIQSLACQLSEAYPNATFVLTTRDFETLWPGWQETLARLNDPSMRKKAPICAGSQAWTDSAPLDKEVKQVIHTVCDQQVLAGQNDACRLFAEKKQKVKQFYEYHEKKIRNCVPQERLLVFPMEMADHDKAQRLQQFLGCNGAAIGQAFPHLNKRTGTFDTCQSS